MRPLWECKAEDEFAVVKFIIDQVEDRLTFNQIEILWEEAYDRCHHSSIEETYNEFASLFRLFERLKDNKY